MINYKDKNRINFYENIAYGLENLSSSSDEVNGLLNEFYNKIFQIKDGITFTKNSNIKLKKDVKKGNCIIREVYIGDLMIGVLFDFLSDYVDFNVDDELSRLISEIYLKLDKIICPYQEDKDSDAQYRYYVEIEYEEENEGK